MVGGVGCSNYWRKAAGMPCPVLRASDWLQLWDHLLCHEPVFLLFDLVAFVRLHGSTLLLQPDASGVARVAVCAVHRQFCACVRVLRVRGECACMRARVCVDSVAAAVKIGIS